MLTFAMYVCHFNQFIDSSHLKCHEKSSGGVVVRKTTTANDEQAGKQAMEMTLALAFKFSLISGKTF